MSKASVNTSEGRDVFFNFRYYGISGVKVMTAHCAFIRMYECEALLRQCLADRERLIDRVRD
jgi:hypothetical protein